MKFYFQVFIELYFYLNLLKSLSFIFRNAIKLIIFTITTL